MSEMTLNTKYFCSKRSSDDKHAIDVYLLGGSSSSDAPAFAMHVGKAREVLELLPAHAAALETKVGGQTFGPQHKMVYIPAEGSRCETIVTPAAVIYAAGNLPKWVAEALAAYHRPPTRDTVNAYIARIREIAATKPDAQTLKDKLDKVGLEMLGAFYKGTAIVDHRAE